MCWPALGIGWFANALLIEHECASQAFRQQCEQQIIEHCQPYRRSALRHACKVGLNWCGLMLLHSLVLGSCDDLAQKADKVIVSGYEDCQTSNMSRRRPSSARMLLPRGAGRLRADLGTFLKNRRQGKACDRRYGTQAQIAAKAGVTRQTLSDIERDAAWPGPATLDLLLDALELGWEHVAHPAGPQWEGQFFIDEMPGGGRLLPVALEKVPDRTREFVEGVEGSLIIAFGERIKAIRMASELTLREVARAAGVSIALLSRLERAQAPRSRLFCFEQRTRDGIQVTVLVIPNSYLQAMWSARHIDGPMDRPFSA